MNCEILDKTGSYDFLTEPFHCDFSHRIFLGVLGNHLLNAADFHSNERGYGMDYLNTVHRTWVLSRFVMELDEMPRAYDRITVETWVDSVMRFFTSRNFSILNAEGKPYGYGKSVWAMIDTETRQPVDILKVRDGLITQYIEKEKQCPIEPFVRVKMAKDAPCARVVDTMYSDVDVNGHINSVKYIEHILNLWGLDWYRSHRLQRLDIAYIAESHYGDKLHIYVDETEENVFGVSVVKHPQDGTDPVEVCKCRVKFVKV